MGLRHIVTGVDGSAASRQAVAVAARLAGQSGAVLRRIRVVPARVMVPERREELQSPVSGGGLEDCVTAVGLPSIEITRYAETEHADLVVLGHPYRSESNRRLVGDTGDAVARRSTCPVLFVRPVETALRRILVALDGSERGMKIVRAAQAVARAGQLELQALTVEPDRRRVDINHAAVPPVAADRLNRELDRLGHDPRRRPALSVRYGDPVTEILEQVKEQQIDVLAFGFHRGGPAGMIEGQSVGRRLLHLAGCAVLTVPL